MASDKDIKSKAPEVTNDKTNTKKKGFGANDKSEKLFDVSAALYAMEHGCKVDIGRDKGKCFYPFGPRAPKGHYSEACNGKSTTGRCTESVWAYCNEAFKAAINNTSDSETKAKIEDIRKKFMNQGGRWGAFVASHNLMEPYGFQKVFVINGPLDAAQRKELSSKCLPGDIAIMKCKEGRVDGRYIDNESWDGHAAMCLDPKTPIWCSDYKQNDWWAYGTWTVDWVVIYRFTNGSYSGNATYSTGISNETCVPCPSNMYNLGKGNLQGSGNLIKIEAFKNLDVSKFNKYACGGYLSGNNILNQIKARTLKADSIPQDFLNTIMKVSKDTGIPPIIYIAVAACESGFKNQPTNNIGYGGYFGQGRYGKGYGYSLEEQAKSNITENAREVMRQVPSASLSDLIQLIYMRHHLPAVSPKYYTVTNGKIHSLDPDYIAENYRKSYPKISCTGLAEGIGVCVSSQYIAAQVVNNPEFARYM